MEPKPVQKPHPPLLFGGVSPRMLGMAGRYSDMVYIAPWVKMPFKKARSLVEKSAEKNRRTSKIQFGTGWHRVQGTFNISEVERDVRTAKNNGCEFFVTAFPQQGYTEAMKQFSEDILPSY